MNIGVKPFGSASGARETVLIRLENSRGMYAELCNYGAALVSLGVPDKQGEIRDIVLGFDSAAGYEKSRYYMGATIGRHAGQIKNGCFSLNGQEYHLVINDHDHTMHGGPNGFHRQIFYWKAGREVVEFMYHSPDGEAGFPGNLDLRVRYQLSESNELTIEYYALCDCDTVLNMTNHAYFNLNGEGTVMNHFLRINADEYTEIDPQGMPTGNILPVKNTPYDFTAPRVISEAIKSDDPQLKWANGYDHNWVLSRENDNEMRLAAELSDGKHLRTLMLYTNQPGLQMYTGNYLDGREQGKTGKPYAYQEALCLEPQLFPNGMEQPEFPSPVLRRGEEYHFLSIYRFI